MTKRILLLVLCCACTVRIWGQQQKVPWNCNNTNVTHLICLLPVATLGTSPGTQNAPAIAFNSTFATQLSQLPLVSAASGLNVEFTAQGPKIISENLGPILTDRAETIGRHKLFLGFFYQRFRFNAIDGTNIDKIPLVLTVTNPTTGAVSQYIQEQLKVDFKLDQYVGVVAFGLSDTTDLAMIIPIERVSIGASSAGTIYNIQPDDLPPTQNLFRQYLPGSASGIGDVVADVKHNFWGIKQESNFKFAGGLFVRFPSGNALNYLGSGAFGFNPYAIFSYQWKVAPHARVAYLWNTNSVVIPSSPTGGSSQLPGGLQYDVGADWAAARQLTIAADFFGNQFLNSPYLVSCGTGGTMCTTIQAGAQPPPSLTPTTRSYTVSDFSIGAKWAPFARKDQFKPLDNLILYVNALFQMNNVGLRSNIVPLAGISYSYTFGK
jgi:hypothetical protein